MDNRQDETTSESQALRMHKASAPPSIGVSGAPSSNTLTNTDASTASATPAFPFSFDTFMGNFDMFGAIGSAPDNNTNASVAEASQVTSQTHESFFVNDGTTHPSGDGEEPLGNGCGFMFDFLSNGYNRDASAPLSDNAASADAARRGANDTISDSFFPQVTSAPPEPAGQDLDFDFTAFFSNREGPSARGAGHEKAQPPEEKSPAPPDQSAGPTSQNTEAQARQLAKQTAMPISSLSTRIAEEGGTEPVTEDTSASADNEVSSQVPSPATTSKSLRTAATVEPYRKRVGLRDAMSVPFHELSLSEALAASAPPTVALDPPQRRPLSRTAAALSVLPAEEVRNEEEQPSNARGHAEDAMTQADPEQQPRMQNGEETRVETDGSVDDAARAAPESRSSSDDVQRMSFESIEAPAPVAQPQLLSSDLGSAPPQAAPPQGSASTFHSDGTASSARKGAHSHHLSLACGSATSAGAFARKAPTQTHSSSAAAGATVLDTDRGTSATPASHTALTDLIAAAQRTCAEAAKLEKACRPSSCPEPLHNSNDASVSVTAAATATHEDTDVSDAVFVAEVAALQQQSSRLSEDTATACASLQAQTGDLLRLLGPHPGLSSLVGEAYDATPVVHLVPLLVALLEDLLTENTDAQDEAAGVDNTE